jgi:hypothetical protein
MSIKKSSPGELSTTKKLNGQILSMGSLSISQDGHTLTEMSWHPDRPDRKAVLVYQRQ